MNCLFTLSVIFENKAKQILKYTIVFLLVVLVVATDLTENALSAAINFGQFTNHLA